MNTTGQETMSMAPVITGPQMIAMTVLTLFFLAAGVFTAAFCGDFSMHPRQQIEMPMSAGSAQQ